MHENVLLTGASGFLGTQIAIRLITQTDSKIIALIRAPSPEMAVLRFKRAWWDWPELYQNIGTRIQVINGDLTKTRLNQTETRYLELTKNITHIIHCAADTTPNLSIDKLRSINVTGTENIIQLAHDINADHGLSRLSHVSTAYVAGKRGGIIAETDLSGESGFSSLYEQTKYESELLLANAKKALLVSVFRPSLIVGDSKTGAVKTFNTVYYMLKQYLTGHLRFIPASSRLKLNIVPVDYVADAITSLTFNPEASGLAFHLTAPNENAPTAKELVRFVQSWAKQNMNQNLPNPQFIPVSPKTIHGAMQLQTRINPKAKSSANAYNTLAPYFNQNQTFNRDNTNRLLGKYALCWQDFLPNLLSYAVYYAFFHRSERTVHEQILHRLESKTKPIRYHEIVDGKIINYDTEAVRQMMLHAAEALKAMGVKKGDAVAIIGNNCVRYLTLDVAVGLAGAVSCPLYPTSPASEINQILIQANAKLFFIGTPKILSQINNIKTDVPIINFSRQPSDSKSVISWETFLSKAKPPVAPPTAPVEFADLGTIRFTYGSTGQPKGACLEHSNLRYVAESLASNFPWKTRTGKASYLSFLPMNHVAEGVSATYSPYFIPSAMTFYYLEDFHDLPLALKLAKPTVVFSIPRFYEKLWSALSSSGLGQQYIKTKNPTKKALLRRIVRFGLLRKSGLDKSTQLIVGAACSSDTLLKDFQTLGVEIYNAYGLSEAPLVTINPIGANNTETVGYPLKNTQIKIADDGEILLKGPQVMRGYLHNMRLVFQDGWLPTGDIGELTPQGYLKILGRKKNIIVTSYGKKIPVEHIEAALKSILHVKECLVVGDNQPFCSAVLWVDCPKIECETQIDKAIEDLNLTLESPAQIERYAVLHGSDMVNFDALKVKRQDLLKQVEPVIDSLYQQKPSS
jgi:long-chain acyl-CoA synthetase